MVLRHVEVIGLFVLAGLFTSAPCWADSEASFSATSQSSYDAGSQASEYSSSAAGTSNSSTAGQLNSSQSQTTVGMPYNQNTENLRRAQEAQNSKPTVWQSSSPVKAAETEKIDSDAGASPSTGRGSSTKVMNYRWPRK
jgi:hypothetical protein